MSNITTYGKREFGKHIEIIEQFKNIIGYRDHLTGIRWVEDVSNGVKLKYREEKIFMTGPIVEDATAIKDITTQRYKWSTSLDKEFIVRMDLKTGVAAGSTVISPVITSDAAKIKLEKIKTMKDYLEDPDPILGLDRSGLWVWVDSRISLHYNVWDISDIKCELESKHSYWKESDTIILTSFGIIVNLDTKPRKFNHEGIKSGNGDYIFQDVMSGYCQCKKCRAEKAVIALPG